MESIYADNAATSFPKPKEVSQAMCNYIENIGANVGRGTYGNSYYASRIVYETRELLCDMFNFHNPLNVVFTLNITESLNTIIKGFLRKGDHVIISSMEHNAVMRPLHSSTLEGIEITKVYCNNDGTLDVEKFKKSIKSNTKLVCMLHVSNVCGTMLPIEQVGIICKNNKIPFVLDSAQSAGVLDIDFKKFNLSALAFTGHKGLLGPQGVGGFIIDSSFSDRLSTLKEGGTGSFSEYEMQPETLPDKYESGTLNIPGIIGLNASLKYINRFGINNIYEYEQELTSLFLEKILNIKGIKLSGLKQVEGRTSVFSIDFLSLDNGEAAFRLDNEFGIMTRVGFHCAPSAHKTLETYPKGSVRFSFGHFNTKKDIEYIVSSISKILR